MGTQTIEAGVKDAAKKAAEFVVDLFIEHPEEALPTKQLPIEKPVVAPTFFANMLNKAKTPFVWAWNEHRTSAIIAAVVAVMVAGGVTYWVCTPDEEELEEANA